jgi:hypothetical protein
LFHRWPRILQRSLKTEAGTIFTARSIFAASTSNRAARARARAASVAQVSLAEGGRRSIECCSTFAALGFTVLLLCVTAVREAVRRHDLIADRHSAVPLVLPLGGDMI